MEAARYSIRPGRSARHELWRLVMSSEGARSEPERQEGCLATIIRVGPRCADYTARDHSYSKYAFDTTALSRRLPVKIIRPGPSFQETGDEKRNLILLNREASPLQRVSRRRRARCPIDGDTNYVDS